MSLTDNNEVILPIELFLINRLTLRVIHVVVIVRKPRNEHWYQPYPRANDRQACFQNRPERDQSEDHFEIPSTVPESVADGGYESAKSIGLSCFMWWTIGGRAFG